MILGSQLLNGRSGHEAGRELLAQLYLRENGGPVPEISVTQWGKPYFVNSPWHFSISHTKRRVFCALSQNNVGIDAEELDRPIRLALADKILSPSEREQFDRAGEKEKSLLTFWVLKEAAAKLAGTGLRGYPSHTAFSLEDSRVQMLDGCLVAILTEE